jgi:putative ABC transport system permease protein
MPVILKISLRNLLRQKRRNILLGIGIAFGTCILIVANAFSYGLSDILLNKLIAVISGHLTVMMTEKYEGSEKKEIKIIRDKDRIKQVILQNVVGVERAEENIQAMARGIGRGSAEFIVLVGVEPTKEFYQEIPVKEGNLTDIENPQIENPVAVYDQMAEWLNVQIHDTLRTKFETVYGQSQSTKFTVVAILKSGNPFMSYALFTHLKILKPLLGYQDHETSFFSVTLKHLSNPETAKEQANRLHTALEPDVSGYKGVVQGNGRSKDLNIFAIALEKEAKQALTSQFQTVSGSLEEALQDAQAAIISQTAADELGIKVGDSVMITYDPKFKEAAPPQNCRVGAIFQANQTIQNEMVFVSADQFYKTFVPYPPKNPVNIDRSSPLSASLLKEWTLLARSPDQTALQKKYTALKKTKWRGTVLDVQTMYESASDVLKLQQVLNVVTLVAVLILFFIILIGVINTLRMTIRERTREIGTVRAIGMQQSDVRWTFMLEVVLLTIFASLTGTILAFGVMKLLALYIFQSTESFFTIFLVNRHLHFVARPGDVIINLIMILLLALVTAYFPARKAAKLSVAAALRHYE